METYHKIHSIFKRDPATNHRTFLMNEYAQPEFEYLKDNIWDFTEKVDGTNIRVIPYPNSGFVEFRGKTDKAQIPKQLLGRLTELFPSDGKLTKQFPDGACLYGEGYGAGIQKGGGNYSPLQEFVLFDIKIGHWWLERKNIEEIAKELGISVVPIVGEGTLKDMVDIVKGGFASTWGNFEAEGIVARPKIGLLQRSGDRIITKLKVKDFK